MHGVGRAVHRRKYEEALHELIPYGGSTWWALSREACELVAAFVARERDFVRFFHHVICPDESFFQTIVGNSELRSQIRRNVTYVDWPDGGQNPSAFTGDHLNRFVIPAP